LEGAARAAHRSSDPSSLRDHGRSDLPGRRSLTAGARTSLLETSGAVFIAVDVVTILVTSITAKILYLDLYLDSDPDFAPYIFIALALGLTLALFYEQMDLYKSSVLADPVIGFGKIWGGLIIAFLVLLGSLYVLKISDQFSRGWVISWFAMNLFALVAARWQTTRWLRQRISKGKLRHTVAIYGSPDFVAELGAEYGRVSQLGDVAGVFFSPNSGSRWGNADGGLDELRGALSQGQYGTIIIALPATDKQAIQTAVKSLASYSVELLLCSDLSQFPVSVSGSRTLGNLRMDVINVVPGSEFSRLAKPLLDYALAGAGLIALAPFLALVALAIKLDSAGPVFFRQRRYGQNNKIFRIFKFRTMTVAEDGPVVVQAKRDDVRVTRIGRFLRRTSLDELPQLINVLYGDMSLVGPRPHALAHDEAFEEQLDLFSRRRRVRPGITGWAQVNGYRGETRALEDILGRMQHDLYYIDNWSIWLDLEIIARTLIVASRRAY
jgi:putative colanic acid biosynthesis UDP-glucose lipid carrier transferase